MFARGLALREGCAPALARCSPRAAPLGPSRPPKMRPALAAEAAPAAGAVSGALRARMLAWEEEARTLADMDEALGLCLDGFDDGYRSQASQDDIVAARFLHEELARALLFSLPTVPEPELPSVSLAAACPTLEDNAVRGAARRVPLDSSQLALLQSVSAPVDVLRAAPDVSRAARTLQRSTAASGERNQRGRVGLAGQADQADLAGQADQKDQPRDADQPASLNHGVADPQHSKIFLRPQSATSTRTLARERMRMERETQSSKDALSNSNQQRMEQLETMLAPKERRPGLGAAQAQKAQEIPDGTLFVVNSRGDIVGTFRNGLPAKLSQIPCSSEPLGGGKTRIEATPGSPAARLGAESGEALQSTLAEITGGRIRGQIEADEAALSSTLDRGRHEAADLSSAIVPSAGVTMRVNGRVRKGRRGADRPGGGGPLQ